MENYNSEMDIQKGILTAIGGDSTKDFDSPYEVQLAILEAVEGGGGGVPEAPEDGSLYGRKDGDWEKIEQQDIEEIIDDAQITTEKTWSSNKIVSYVDNATDDKVASSTVDTIWSGTQAQYDAIATKSDSTLYVIKEEV